MSVCVSACVYVRNKGGERGEQADHPMVCMFVMTSRYWGVAL